MKSDMQLQRDVRAAVNPVSAVDGAEIEVTVRDGIVTLTGSVASYIVKWQAESAAGRVSGVRALAVELRVQLEDASPRGDTDIARAAANALDWSARLPGKSVRIMVDNGHVTLNGELEWEYQREAATTVVRWLTGVTGVSNNTVIKPRSASRDNGEQASGDKPDLSAARS